MAKRMLVDASHPDETRVAVLNGNKLEEFDFELKSRKQLKGNIYLAKVVRVEPSLQAAFVEYGGNRHGFLAFSEIHPDYYRIPIADREALLAELAAQSQEDDFDLDDAPLPEPPSDGETNLAASPDITQPLDTNFPTVSELESGDHQSAEKAEKIALEEYLPETASPALLSPEATISAHTTPSEESVTEHDKRDGERDEDDGSREEKRRFKPYRRYKIQEVIHKRQILLVQVVKEERGNKGAALTTYLSLPGRYCVLMPNTPRGGGISRKITNPGDRKRLKDMMEAMGVPDGMAVILRTAGMERTEPEIRRDLDYLMKLWDTVREETLQSVAPKLIYEEANLIKRSIRDLYSEDIAEIHVEGDEAYAACRDLMHVLMPSHTRKVHHYKSHTTPLFMRYQVENQIDSTHTPTVQLRSGGYIVINQTEALVAIDVNSGRATRERNIEETAFRTNLEAADEIARQARLRDLAGLIVIDFIDMEEGRNNAAVERRLKEAMKTDRARIQIGRISPFGLLEMSRQRLRPSITEAHFEKCAHCSGTGHLRSPESAASFVMRALEEESYRRRCSEIKLFVPTRVALCLLNQKRAALASMEQRYNTQITVLCDDTLIPPQFKLERIRVRSSEEEDDVPVTVDQVLFSEAAPSEAGVGAEEISSASDEITSPPHLDESSRPHRRRSRNRRGQHRHESFATEESGSQSDSPSTEPDAPFDEVNSPNNGHHTQRRRGRRGGRRRHDYAENRQDIPALPDLDAPTMSIDALFEASERAYEQKASHHQNQSVENPEQSGSQRSPGSTHHQRRPPRGPRQGQRGRGRAAHQRGPHRSAGTERSGDFSSPELSSPSGMTSSAPQKPSHNPSEGPTEPRRKGWWNKLIGS